MEDCALKAVKETIEKMKEEIARTQQIPYPEQIVVAEIYNVVARVLCEACRKEEMKKENCKPEEMKKRDEVNLDAFILLKQLKDDRLISEEYYEKLFEGLIKIKPELEKQAREDKARGLI
ncbi:MAG: hypothetical protein QXR09_00230 [Candidatus Aenigmatarchaeota archaeon]